MVRVYIEGIRIINVLHHFLANSKLTWVVQVNTVVKKNDSSCYSKIYSFSDPKSLW